MPSGGYRSRGSEKGASIAMSAPTATFVVTLTMLTMTLAKVQDYVDGRRGLAATAEAGGRNAEGRRWAPWIRWPPRVWNIRRSRGRGSQAEERHEGLADEVVEDDRDVLVRVLSRRCFQGATSVCGAMRRRA